MSRAGHVPRRNSAGGGKGFAPGMHIRPGSLGPSPEHEPAPWSPPSMPESLLTAASNQEAEALARDWARFARYFRAHARERACRAETRARVVEDAGWLFGPAAERAFDRAWPPYRDPA